MDNITDINAILTAKRNLRLFLEEHPHLKPLQAELDAQLKGAVTFHNKVLLLTAMMRENVIQMRDKHILLMNEFNKLKVLEQRLKSESEKNGI